MNSPAQPKADVRGDGADGVGGFSVDLTTQLMRVMTEEAERCLAEGVVQSADDVDFALLSGAGFPAFRGGLLHWARKRPGPLQADSPR